MGLVDTVLRFFVGTRNERLVKALRPRVQQVLDLFPYTNKLTDEELKGKTAEFRQLLREAYHQGGQQRYLQERASGQE